jgi:hypothetical protein
VVAPDHLSSWSDGIVRVVDERPSLEAIVLYLDPSGIRHVYPHGRETLRAPWDPDLDPTESIVDSIAELGLAPAMVHSTSWRVVRRQVVLTFLVVIERPTQLPPSCEVEQVTRAELARGRATGAPVAVHLSQVVEHGLRHLAWLVFEDEAIHDALAPWSEALADYQPEPFRAFGHDPAAEA